MRCPKCQYLGFEGQGRCRNCGYDLSLTTTQPTPEPTSDTAVDAAPVDLPLRSEPTARERARAAIRERVASARTPSAEAFDLPLFPGAAEPRSMASPSPAPRAPLSVRRATIEPPRTRGGVGPAPATVSTEIDPDEPLLSADTPSDEAEALPIGLSPMDAGARGEPTLPPGQDSGLAERPHEEPLDSALRVTAAEAEAASRLAPLGARVVGGLLDAAILGAVDVAVLAFTLRLTNLAWSEIGRLPPTPLLAFLALLAVGYLSMFTLLSGQTAGQMVAGIRVVELGGTPVRFGHAVVRAVAQVITVPLFGIGFLPAVLGTDRRALYDRLSDTEVIRSDA
jgi:uncharacterized RDD family membrane protein YckC